MSGVGRDQRRVQFNLEGIRILKRTREPSPSEEPADPPDDGTQPGPSQPGPSQPGPSQEPDETRPPPRKKEYHPSRLNEDREGGTLSRPVGEQRANLRERVQELQDQQRNEDHDRILEAIGFAPDPLDPVVAEPVPVVIDEARPDRAVSLAELNEMVITGMEELHMNLEAEHGDQFQVVQNPAYPEVNPEVNGDERRRRLHEHHFRFRILRGQLVGRVPRRIDREEQLLAMGEIELLREEREREGLRQRREEGRQIMARFREEQRDAVRRRRERMERMAEVERLMREEAGLPRPPQVEAAEAPQPEEDGNNLLQVLEEVDAIVEDVHAHIERDRRMLEAEQEREEEAERAREEEAQRAREEDAQRAREEDRARQRRELVEGRLAEHAALMADMERRIREREEVRRPPQNEEAAAGLRPNVQEEEQMVEFLDQVYGQNLPEVHPPLNAEQNFERRVEILEQQNALRNANPPPEPGPRPWIPDLAPAPIPIPEPPRQIRYGAFYDFVRRHLPHVDLPAPRPRRDPVEPPVWNHDAFLRVHGLFAALQRHVLRFENISWELREIAAQSRENPGNPRNQRIMGVHEMLETVRVIINMLFRHYRILFEQQQRREFALAFEMNVNQRFDHFCRDIARHRAQAGLAGEFRERAESYEARYHAFRVAVGIPRDGGDPMERWRVLVQIGAEETQRRIEQYLAQLRQQQMDELNQIEVERRARIAQARRDRRLRRPRPQDRQAPRVQAAPVDQQVPALPPVPHQVEIAEGVEDQEPQNPDIAQPAAPAPPQAPAVPQEPLADDQAQDPRPEDRQYPDIVQLTVREVEARLMAALRRRQPPPQVYVPQPGAFRVVGNPQAPPPAEVAPPPAEQVEQPNPVDMFFDNIDPAQVRQLLVWLRQAEPEPPAELRGLLAQIAARFGQPTAPRAQPAQNQGAQNPEIAQPAVPAPPPAPAIPPAAPADQQDPRVELHARVVAMEQEVERLLGPFVQPAQDQGPQEQPAPAILPAVPEEQQDPRLELHARVVAMQQEVERLLGPYVQPDQNQGPQEQPAVPVPPPAPAVPPEPPAEQQAQPIAVQNQEPQDPRPEAPEIAQPVAPAPLQAPVLPPAFDLRFLQLLEHELNVLMNQRNVLPPLQLPPVPQFMMQNFNPPPSQIIQQDVLNNYPPWIRDELERAIQRLVAGQNQNLLPVPPLQLQLGPPAVPNFLLQPQVFRAPAFMMQRPPPVLQWPPVPLPNNVAPVPFPQLLLPQPLPALQFIDVPPVIPPVPVAAPLAPAPQPGPPERPAEVPAVLPAVQPVAQPHRAPAPQPGPPMIPGEVPAVLPAVQPVAQQPRAPAPEPEPPRRVENVRELPGRGEIITLDDTPPDFRVRRPVLESPSPEPADPQQIDVITLGDSPPPQMPDEAPVQRELPQNRRNRLKAIRRLYEEYYQTVRDMEEEAVLNRNSERRVDSDRRIDFIQRLRISIMADREIKRYCDARRLGQDVEEALEWEEQRVRCHGEAIARYERENVARLRRFRASLPPERRFPLIVHDVRGRREQQRDQSSDDEANEPHNGSMQAFVNRYANAVPRNFRQQSPDGVVVRIEVENADDTESDESADEEGEDEQPRPLLAEDLDAEIEDLFAQLAHDPNERQENEQAEEENQEVPAENGPENHQNPEQEEAMEGVQEAPAHHPEADHDYALPAAMYRREPSPDRDAAPPALPGDVPEDAEDAEDADEPMEEAEENGLEGVHHVLNAGNFGEVPPRNEEEEEEDPMEGIMHLQLGVQHLAAARRLQAQGIHVDPPPYPEFRRVRRFGADFGVVMAREDVDHPEENPAEDELAAIEDAAVALFAEAIQRREQGAEAARAGMADNLERLMARVAPRPAAPVAQAPAPPPVPAPPPPQPQRPARPLPDFRAWMRQNIPANEIGRQMLMGRGRWDPSAERRRVAQREARQLRLEEQARVAAQRNRWRAEAREARREAQREARRAELIAEEQARVAAQRDLWRAEARRLIEQFAPGERAAHGPRVIGEILAARYEEMIQRGQQQEQEPVHPPLPRPPTPPLPRQEPPGEAVMRDEAEQYLERMAARYVNRRAEPWRLIGQGENEPRDPRQRRIRQQLLYRNLAQRYPDRPLENIATMVRRMEHMEENLADEVRQGIVNREEVVEQLRRRRAMIENPDVVLGVDPGPLAEPVPQGRPERRARDDEPNLDEPPVRRARREVEEEEFDIEDPVFIEALQRGERWWLPHPE